MGSGDILVVATEMEMEIKKRKENNKNRAIKYVGLDTLAIATVAGYKLAKRGAWKLYYLRYY